ncbi:glycosyltransferase [Phenylobacterium sp. J426]|uniref:glycosyltransferase n=1 Tax=Phenylobacterium sp. J426 TaxID=2898439 RepID=UPI0021507B55|nr:glycosyltransferase [Phenylobacterium sp. J426]MCR5876744.1 glycosyltransferase [Phenylobacterium sp. J426]
MERQAEILSHAVARRGWRVTLLAPTLQGPHTQVVEERFGETIRFRLSALPAAGGRHIAATLAWTHRTMCLIMARRAELDGVYVLHHRLHCAGPLLGAQFAGLPVLIKPGGGGEASEFHALRAKKYLYGHLVAHLVRRTTRWFIANSQTIVEDLLKEGVPEARILALPNGVEAPAREVVAQAIAGRTGARFIYAARLVADKQTSDLVRAAALLPRDREWTVTIVGDGPDRPALIALTGELGLQDRVVFTGAVADPGDLLLGHDIYVSPSPREGQSNALLEAMVRGLIPVCVEASGVRDLLGDDKGVIAAPHAPAALAAAMLSALRLSRAVKSRLSWRIRDHVAEHYGIDRVAAQTLALLS